MLLQLPRHRHLDLSRPKVMGILNITRIRFLMVAALLAKTLLWQKPGPCLLQVLLF